ncbi:MAG: hypothetical protein HY962_05405 [Ignavibacteriae bacterium]|nr:hypothetical protein [Ignavibacteriota bacterium]
MYRFLMLLPLLLPFAHAEAQLMIAPTSVFIDPDSKTGTFLVKNTSETAREVSIEFFFGYPASDENGKLFMQKNDSVTEKRHSLVPHLKVFPRKLVIPPGEEQYVKLLVRDAGSLVDGAYWTRMVVRSLPAVKPITPEVHGDSTLAQLVIAVEQVTAAVYLKGKTTANVSVDSIRSKVDSNGVSILCRFTRSGNSPYWGVARVRVLDARGEPVAETLESIAVYYELVRRFHFEAGKLPPGNYTAEIMVNGSRDDIPKEQQSQSPPHTVSKALAIGAE